VQRQAVSGVPTEVLRERVAQEVRTAILRGDLQPGSPVKEDDLAAQLGVPRQPVRHALQLLEREGLVHFQPNRTARVAPLDRRVIADVYVFREALETSTVVMLARRPKFDAKPFRQIIARGRAAVRQRDYTALIDLDMSFHTGLYEAAGNRVVIDVMRSQWSHIRRGLGMVLDQAAYRLKIWEEHEGIVNAIAARKVALAAAAAGHHIRAARDTLLAAFDAAPTTHPIPATGAVNRPAIRLNRGRLH